MARGEQGVMEIERGADAYLGEIAPAGDDLGEVGFAGEVARGGDEPDALAQLAQALVQGGLVGAGRLGHKGPHRRAAERLGELPGHRGREVRLRRQQAAAVAGTAGDAVECGRCHGLNWPAELESGV